jgi:GTP-binding protein
MPKPVVVIVGRPNAGKSTLFNRMARLRRAIVDDTAGVTRDRNYTDAEWEGREFRVVDTGGFYPEPPGDIEAQAKEQAMFAVDEASLIVHLLDGKEGINPLDNEIYGILRASGKKVLSAVNKVDGPKNEQRITDFYSLGAEELMPVSAETGYNFDDFMDRLVSCLPAYAPEETFDYPKVAVVGRPNVGKSTLINSLLGKRRLIVSPVAGTTRDSIDTVCAYHGRRYLFIDTAGIRRKAKKGYSLERFSVLSAMRSIERCDVSLVLFDAVEGITADDQKIAGIVHKYGKGAILLLNKWDLVLEPEAARERLLSDIEKKLWFFGHAPALTISGLERKRVTKVFPLIDNVMAERQKKIGRAELNRFLDDALKDASIPLHKGKRPKIYYMNQVASGPPAFTLFTNSTEGLKEPFMRYLEGRLRQRFSFGGTPVIIMKRLKR